MAFAYNSPWKKSPLFVPMREKTMSDETKSIFTEKATDKLRSPDDLDEYVRVTNPSVWVVFGACAVLLIGLFAWGFFGTAETNVGAMGAYVDGEVVCFLPADKASNVHEGDIANVDGELMEVASVGAVPVSRVEAKDIVGGDYLASTLVGDDWTYVVRFGGNGDYEFADGIPLSVNITTERIAPISLIFKGAADD